PFRQDRKQEIHLHVPADDVSAGEAEEDDDQQRETRSFVDYGEAATYRVPVDGVYDEGDRRHLQDDRSDMNDCRGQLLQRVVADGFTRVVGVTVGLGHWITLAVWALSGLL